MFGYIVLKAIIKIRVHNTIMLTYLQHYDSIVYALYIMPIAILLINIW